MLQALPLMLVLALSVPQALAGQTKPTPMVPLFEENPTDGSDLSAQSRVFERQDRATLLDASASVLLDMGFRITGGHSAFGVVVGEKTADVPPPGAGHTVAEAALVTTTLLLSLLVGEDVVTDLPEQVQQHVHVSLHVRPLNTSNAVGNQVRISIDRDMIYDDGSSIPDHTELVEVYEEFFGKLEKAVYLEGEQL